MSVPRLFLTLSAVLAAAVAAAQGQRVVVDLETDLPVAMVSVQGQEHSVTTDSLGRFAVPDGSRTLLFSHVNYESRLVNLEDIRDTVFLVSKYLSLREVVVFGKGRLRDDELSQLKSQLRMNRTELQLRSAQPQQGFNPLGLLSYILPKKWFRGGKKERRRQQHQHVLDEY